MKKIIAFLLFLFLLSALKASATYPPGFYCYNAISDLSPADWEEDVEIGLKGVQFCANVTPPDGCTVNVTFQWFNWHDVEINHTWSEDYWYNFSFWSDISSETQLCVYNDNVSCSTENWWTHYFEWRIILNFSCENDFTYQTTCWYIFFPEECPLFYIYPPWNVTDVCPCADVMCLGIRNTEGNPMNITFYRNDSQFEDFYIINKLFNVDNGTYCFCIDGHINDSIYYPMRLNETYYWYVNVTDTVTDEYNVSDIFHFTTAQNRTDCISGDESFGDIPPYGQTVGLFGLVGLLGFIWGISRRRKYGEERYD